MTATTLRFKALDTLFFRESRPMEAIGGSELASLFPPPPRTIAGALRTAIGEALGVDWKAFQRAMKTSEKSYTVGGVDLYRRIGCGDDLGGLSITGVWLSERGERLYPAPLYLMRKTEGQATTFKRLRIGPGAHTSLGRVRLPHLSEGGEGYKPVEGAWLTREGLEQVLQGGTPGKDQWRERRALIAEEPRLGITRDNARRTVQTGLLYQTRHIRPRPDVAVEADVSGLEGVSLVGSVLRFGGEGRLAGVETAEAVPFPNSPQANGDTQGLVFTLLTPARFVSKDNEPIWLPPVFGLQSENGFQVWKGNMKGVDLTLHSAITGKAQREGGWDMARHAPRPAQSLIPVGSSYYCTVDDGDLAAAIETLHGKAIGEDRQLGRGRIACGLWSHNESTNTEGKRS